jgi:hypothetical protein
MVRAFGSKDNALSKECFFDLYRCVVVNSTTCFEAEQSILANTGLFLEFDQTPLEGGSRHSRMRRR